MDDVVIEVWETGEDIAGEPAHYVRFSYQDFLPMLYRVTRTGIYRVWIRNTPTDTLAKVPIARLPAPAVNAIYGLRDNYSSSWGIVLPDLRVKKTLDAPVQEGIK